MLARLRNWLFDGGGPQNLPERVRETIRQQQERSEILIGWAELVLTGLLAIAYETTTMAARRGAGRVIRSKPRSSSFYGVFSIVRLILAYRRPLPEWLLLPVGDCRHGPADGADLFLSTTSTPSRPCST